MNTAFSTFTNTAENPVLLDEEDNHHSPVLNPKTAEKQVLRVRKKINEKPGLRASMEEASFHRISAPPVEPGTDEKIPIQRGKKRKEAYEVFGEKREPASISTKGVLNTDAPIQSNTIVARATSQKNTPKFTIEIGSSSRVTRSQKIKKELEMDITERKGCPISYWNLKLLKKRESFELKDGGFGLLPLKDIRGTIEEMPRTEPKSGKVYNGQQQRQQSGTDMPRTELKSGKVDNGQQQRQQSGSEMPRTEPKSGKVDNGQQHCQQSGPDGLMDIIRERIALIRELKEESESDIQKGLNEHVNDDGFAALQLEMNNLFKSTTPFGGTTPKAPTRTKFLSPCTDIVLSQQIDDPLAALWDSPTYVSEVGESMRISVDNSKTRRFLDAIEPPGFDLGISPMKDTTCGGGGEPGSCGSGLRVDKGKGKLFDEPTDTVVWGSGPRVAPVDHAYPLNMVNPSTTNSGPFDEKVETKLVQPKKEKCEPGDAEIVMRMRQNPPDNDMNARISRRTVKLGDHLKSPYVTRVVDFNVTSEDRKVHEWALSIFGGKW
ncbi:hypothetical protein L6452_05986 [Arctium lappa]|uniref:Uncharacterized protein n=1 Tax=Arctium lappa TaxID=4217 RepID=A0ACB9EI71_ARCLA|nr:hypothetical protein L6452_05986 [Arctium lappa]